LIPGLIYGIESGVGLPETCFNDKKERAIEAIMHLYKDFHYSDDDEEEEDEDILEAAFALARSHGFQLTSLIQEMEKRNQKKHVPDAKKKLTQRLSLAFSASIDMGSSQNAVLPRKRSTDIEANLSETLPRNNNRLSMSDASCASTGMATSPSLTLPRKNRRLSSSDLTNSSLSKNGERRRSSTRNLMTEVLKTYNMTNVATRPMKRRPSNHYNPNEVAYEPWKLNSRGPDYVKNLDKRVLDTWGLVFCGRNVGISKTLHNVTDEFGINMIEERFEW